MKSKQLKTYAYGRTVTLSDINNFVGHDDVLISDYNM